MLTIVFFKFVDDYGYTKVKKAALDLDKWSATDLKSTFDTKYPDYQLVEMYRKSDNGTKLKMFPYQDVKPKNEFIKKEELDSNQEVYEEGLGLNNDVSDDEAIREQVKRYSDDYGPEDYYGSHFEDSLDSIQVERVDDCSMTISKSKITNDKFRDSVKTKVADSKNSITFDGKTEDVIDDVVLATGMTKEDVIEMLISNL